MKIILLLCLAFSTQVFAKVTLTESTKNLEIEIAELLYKKRHLVSCKTSNNNSSATSFFGGDWRYSVKTTCYLERAKTKRTNEFVKLAQFKSKIILIDDEQFLRERKPIVQLTNDEQKISIIFNKDGDIIDSSVKDQSL